MASTVSWVSDKLHDILGLSDRYIAEFLVELAKKSNSGDNFVRRLKETGAIDVNQAVEGFAQELWSRVPHKQSVEKPARALEREALLQQQKNKRYALLSDSEGEEDQPSSHQKSSRKTKSTDKNSRKRKHIRQEKASAWESDEEGDEVSATKKGKPDSDSDEWER